MKYTASYIVYFEPATNGWVSQCLITGVASQGDTKQEAIGMLKDALTLYYDEEPAELNFTQPENIEVGSFAFSV